MWDVTVIGGGVFGCLVAAEAAKQGLEVLLVEKHPSLLEGATGNNQNRLHLGLHYPRDPLTAQQSISGAISFLERFRESIRLDFPNYYFIAREGSRTDAAGFEEFARVQGLKLQRLAKSDWDACGVDRHEVTAGWASDEGVIDVERLRMLVAGELSRLDVTVRLGTEAFGLVSMGDGSWVLSSDAGEEKSKVVVLATYGLDSLSPESDVRSEYQHTVVPIVTPTQDQVGITIMDGDFLTVLPRGFTSQALVYSPSRSVLSRATGHVMPPDIRASDADVAEAVTSICEVARRYAPGLGFSLVGDCLETVRRIPADAKLTDQRQSSISEVARRCYRIHSGKVDHAIWLAKGLVSRIVSELHRVGSNFPE